MSSYEQIIYFGSPGTGKSHLVNEKLKNIDESKIFRITIHPEFTYSDFIGQILPIEKNQKIHFEFKPGIFTRALKEAFEEFDKPVYLVIEEVSRGNVAAIFGDIFQLLDRDEYFQSKYPIRNKDVANEIVELDNDMVYLPSNFNFIGTVNTNDQSVFPMDTAFKRRFDWEYVSVKPVKDDKGNIIEINNPKIRLIDFNNNYIEIDWFRFYNSLNNFITDKSKGLGKSEDKQIGQFFLNFDKKLIKDSYSNENFDEAMLKINNIIKNKLLLYLWQDVEGRNSFFSQNSLFNESINSFDDLYFKYESEAVFNEVFINEFLQYSI